MEIFYSSVTGGFYKVEIHGDLIPEDAVEISSADYQVLIDGQGQGGRIKPDVNGYPFLEFPPEPTDAARRSTAKIIIDRQAGAARERFVSPGDLIDQEYLAAETAAQDFKAAGYPSSNVPPEVQSWADAASMTTIEAADDIIATGENWRGVLSQVREVRLAGKAAVDAAAAGDIETTTQTYIEQLQSMAPA